MYLWTWTKNNITRFIYSFFSSFSFIYYIFPFFCFKFTTTIIFFCRHNKNNNNSSSQIVLWIGNKIFQKKKETEQKISNCIKSRITKKQQHTYIHLTHMHKMRILHLHWWEKWQRQSVQVNWWATEENTCATEWDKVYFQN